MKYVATFLLICANFAATFCQKSGSTITCGTDDVHAEQLKTDPVLAEQEQVLEAQYRAAMTAVRKGSGSSVLTLPVVVHIIHDNGPENISDARVQKGIEYLNDAFRNRNYYNPATGVDVEIEFCLAKRDIQGNAFSGIRRIQSQLTDMSATSGSLSALTNWDTKNYINITLVREVCLYGDCAVAGYANTPGAHGQPGDGIVMEAEYFGSSPRDGVVTAHEMGHYLGLRHTFQGGCKNDDCLLDGDRVCDTPPDNMTGPYPCTAAYNSCQTDSDDTSPNNPFRGPALGGLGDQNDMLRNYMDYSILECYDRFTSGQKARMRFFLEALRTPLLSSKACLPSCPQPVTALFAANTDSVPAGGQVAVQNLSQHAASYRWLLDGTPVSAAVDTMFSFPDTGAHLLQLVALGPQPECEHDTFDLIIQVYCPVSADFSYTLTADSLLVLTDHSANAGALLWTIRDGAGLPFFSSAAPLDTFDASGQQYLQVCLTASNTHCASQKCQYIKLAADGVEICNNSLDDDGDGLVDLFDPGCPCNNNAYQAFCPTDCEYLPDSFPLFSMKVKWVSEIIDNFKIISPNVVTGDTDGDGKANVVSPLNLVNGVNTTQSIIIIDGSTGTTSQEIILKPAFTGFTSIADIDKDGKSEVFSIYGDTILCYSSVGNLLWKSDKLVDQRGYLANICDFNEDGAPELYVGNQIFNAMTGKLLASGAIGFGGNIYVSSFSLFTRKHTIAADLLPTPGLELAAGNTVYTVNINNLNGLTGNSMVPVIAPTPVKDGFTSVGDIDGDGALDVVVVRDKSYPDGGGIWAWNPRTGNIIASANAGNRGGVPFIGDVTGDCVPEIGMTFTRELRMYQYDGNPQLKLLYSLPTTDGSGFTGITMFDFNQDGRQELVYRDETDLRILEGSTGKTLASYPMKSITGIEYPVIADVDRDGQADILVNGYQKDSAGVIDLRVYCFESAGAPWAPARSVWNQYGYHVTNVNDDLTIPRYPQNSAAALPGHETCLQPTCPAPYNAFLAQATYRTQQGCVQFPAADLGLKILGYECTPDSLIFHVAIDQPGGKATGAACIYLSRYAEKPQPGVGPLETVCQPVNPDAPLDDTLRLAWPLPSGIDRMYFVVNDPGTGANAQNYPLTGLIECNYANNADSIDLDIAPHTLDLGPDIVKCASAVLTFNAGPGFESYRWSDGTQDSIYSSGNAGLHFVEATDHCQRVYRDTVEVIIDPAGDIDLGPDTLVCPGEPLRFSLSGDFDFIQWLPAGSVDCDTCVQVSAVTDTALLLMAVAGKGNCFSVDTVAIGIKPAPSRELALSLCSGDSVQVSDQWLSGAGVHSILVNAATGCDTVYEVTLTEIPPISRSETLSICAGDSVFLFNQWISQAGTLSQTFTGAFGCDSTQTYDVLVTPLNHKSAAYSLCAGDSVQVAGQWLSGAGVHNILVSGIAGCDTIYAVTLTEIPPVSKSETVSICAGDSVFLFNQWVKQPGTLSQTFANAAGCDSTQTYDVVVASLNHKSVAYSLCAGDSVQVAGQWLSGAGMYNVLISGIAGCDTIYAVTLTEIPPVSKSETVSICAGDSVLLFNQWVKQAGTLSQTFASVAGCDSTQTYEVLFAPPAHKAVSYSVCAGDSVQVGGQWLSAAGLHSVLVQIVGGCDTVYEVTLTEIPPVSRSETVPLCAGDSVFLFNQWVKQAGTLSQTFAGASGCDSTQTYEVLVTPLNHRQVAYSVCAGDSVLLGGQWLSGAGLHNVLVNGVAGCDTIYAVILTEIPPVSKSEMVSLCAGDSVLLFNQWVKQAGTLSQTFSSVAGCDSTQTYTVTVTPLTHRTFSYSLCAGDSVQVGGQWLWGAGLHTVLVNAASGCDTIYEVTLTEIPPVSKSETVSICAGDSVFLFNKWVKQPGMLSQTFAGASGCDSIQTYEVIVTPLNHRQVAYSLCAGDSVQVSGQWLTGAGLYSVLVNATGGCDTVYAVTLTEIPAIVRVDSLTLCPGDSIWVNNNWIKESDALSEVYTAASGCDSVQTFVISTLEAPAPPTAQTDCDHLETLLHIQAAGNWTILWSNGDTLRQTTYKNADTARVTLYALPDCHVEFQLALPALPDTAQLPGLSDTTLYAGHPLSFDLDLDPAEWQLRWEPAAIFSCDTCPGTVALPTNNTLVEVTYRHRSGCVYGSRFLIALRNVSAFYVPNVFSPNGDGVNDLWTFVPPGGIERFDEVLVFDRWGNQLADWKNVPHVAWDGTFRDKALNPGVFAYYLRFTDANGENVEKKGDVTIVW